MEFSTVHKRSYIDGTGKWSWQYDSVGDLSCLSVCIRRQYNRQRGMPQLLMRYYKNCSLFISPFPDHMGSSRARRLRDGKRRRVSRGLGGWSVLEAFHCCPGHASPRPSPLSCTFSCLRVMRSYCGVSAFPPGTEDLCALAWAAASGVTCWICSVLLDWRRF